MSHTRLGAVSSLITLALIGTSHVQAQSLVNLELRAPAVDVVAGTTFEVGLYAVANPGPTQTVGDVRAIFTWDNAVLSFSGVHLDTGHPWQQSGFFLDADGLNTDLTDGLAMYRATAAPGNLGIADTAGLLITKFEFTALVATSPGTTAVDILASAGATPTTTRVLDDVTGGADVTGTLIGDVVTVVVCLSALDCDDTDECTTESCSSGVCSYTLDYIPDVECCNPVTGFTQPIDDGNDCTTDLCGPDGSVTHQNKPFDTPCGRPDEFPCSFQDTCDSSGTCLPNHAANGSFCNEDGDDCTNDFCQDGVCVLNTTDPDGTNCDDGLDVCTPGQDVCQGGVCTGTSDPCLGDPAGPYCVEIGGQAVCRECRVGHPEDCPDNGCVEGFCDLFGTCRPNPDDTLCADGAYCNGVETCNATTGLCDSDPNPQLCIDPAFPFCDEATDTCEVCLVDADCANGITCDGVETCNTGVVPHTCDPGTPLTCPPDEPCATYVCQEPDGSCLRVPINEGLELCNDADGCTVADTCVGGACVGSPPLGIGGVSLALMLPPGAPTQYSVGETIEVDLHAVLYDAIKSCSVSATACTTDADCPVGEFCIFPTSHEFRLIESVLTWDPALLDIDSLNVLDPCDTCDGCRIGCTTDADCLVDVPSEDDCLCPATGAPPPCPPNTGSAECRQKVVGYPDSCPASPDPVLCSATCPPGQYDWGAGLFPSGSFDPNGINDSHNDGDAYFVNQIAFGASLPSVSTTQSLWVARFAFTVQSGQGQQTEITFDLCQPEGGVAPTLTRVLGAGASMVTGDLTGLTVGIGGCSDTACDDGLYCNGAETCSDPQCDPTQPGCCVAGTPPCTDGDACTSDVCTESDDTCSYPPNYDPATDCCDPATGGLMPLEDGNDCTEGVCDPATGIVVQNPLPAGTPCNDFDNCTEPDTCDGAGTCSGVQIPDCTGCQSDADCNDGVACTVDTCVNQECEFVPDDSLCADNGLYCDGREVCNQMLGCVSTGNPCPPECVEAATPHCPCETPDVSGGGPRYIAMRPRALDSTVPVKFRVDWPGEGVPCFSRYVGSLRCGGTGDACTTDADCNECSFSGVPCLTDADCDFGRCTDGQECSVSAQNCLDQSECLRSESCTISGDLCETAPLQTIDINNDGLDDGMLGVLVDAAGAVEMTPLEWSGGLMRCSKSASPCVVDADCSRGRCITTGAFCDVFVQNCFDGAECVLDEECVPGAVYVYGDDIVPSEYVAATQTHVPTTYEVTAECGLGTPPPATVVMWRWGDTSHDSFVNVTDISLILLAMQGQYDFSTKVTDDLSGSDACWVQQVLNITDVLFAKRAFQGEHYYDTACDHPTCP